LLQGKVLIAPTQGVLFKVRGGWEQERPSPVNERYGRFINN